MCKMASLYLFLSSCFILYLESLLLSDSIIFDFWLSCWIKTCLYLSVSHHDFFSFHSSRSSRLFIYISLYPFSSLVSPTHNPLHHHHYHHPTVWQRDKVNTETSSLLLSAFPPCNSSHRRSNRSLPDPIIHRRPLRREGKRKTKDGDEDEGEVQGWFSGLKYEDGEDEGGKEH